PSFTYTVHSPPLSHRSFPTRRSSDLQVAVARADTVGMPQLDQVAVAVVFPAHARHETVGRGAHGGAVGRGEVDPLVTAPPVQHRVVAAAEAAGHAAELQRRSQEGALQRAPLLVEEAGGAVR